MKKEVKNKLQKKHNNEDLEQSFLLKKEQPQVKPNLSHLSSSHTIADLQKTFGNIASIRFLSQNEMIQPKLRAGHSLSLYESKKNSYNTSEALESQNFSHLTSIQPRIQRFPADDSTSQTEQTSPALDTPTTTTQDSATQTTQTATRPLLMEDSATDLEPGQMRKTEFLNQLRPAVCQTAESGLAGTIWSAMGCPWIDRWFNYYSGRSATQIEQSLRGYTPGASTVTRAGAYIPLVCQKIHQAIHTWTTTGEITGVPDEMAGSLPLPAGSDASENNSDSGTLGRVGNMVSGLESLFFKEESDHSTGSRESSNLHGQLSPGRPLSSSIKSRMEPVFGQDFSNVRIHTESKDANISHELNARAFTIGQDIAFGAGEYQPGSLVGDALIAHELAHVVQQGGSGSSPMQKKTAETGFLEDQADLSAVNAIAAIWGGMKSGTGNHSIQTLSSAKTGLRLQRCFKGCSEEPAISWSDEEWERNSGELRAAGDRGEITTEEESLFIEAINHALGGNAPEPIQLPVEKFEGDFDVDDAHVYFDKNLWEVHAKTSAICRMGNVVGLSTQCAEDKGEGGAIIMGPLSIQETRDYTRSIIRHEHSHLMDIHRHQREGIDLPSLANSEVTAYSRQLYYINALTAEEIKGTIKSYLVYYINADPSSRNEGDVRIVGHINSRLPEGPRTPSEILTALNDVRSEINSGSITTIPPSKRDIALQGLQAIIDAVNSL